MAMARKVNYILDLNTTNLIPKHRITSLISIFLIRKDTETTMVYEGYMLTNGQLKNLTFDKF